MKSSSGHAVLPGGGRGLPISELEDIRTTITVRPLVSSCAATSPSALFFLGESSVAQQTALGPLVQPLALTSGEHSRQTALSMEPQLLNDASVVIWLRVTANDNELFQHSKSAPSRVVHKDASGGTMFVLSGDIIRQEVRVGTGANRFVWYRRVHDKSSGFTERESIAHFVSRRVHSRPPAARRDVLSLYRIPQLHQLASPEKEKQFGSTTCVHIEPVATRTRRCQVALQLQSRSQQGKFLSSSKDAGLLSKRVAEPSASLASRAARGAAWPVASQGKGAAARRPSLFFFCVVLVPSRTVQKRSERAGPRPRIKHFKTHVFFCVVIFSATGQKPPHPTPSPLYTGGVTACLLKQAEIK